MELKSEKSIRDYLKKLPDDTIIKYYLDVEFSPFPVLIIEEYQRRFKRKTKEEILRKLKFQASLAKRKSKKLSLMARQNKLVNEVAKQKSEEILHQAKKKGMVISKYLVQKGTVLGAKAQQSAKKGIEETRKLTSSERDLHLLEKLAELQKEGVITEKEFKAKKKKILSRI